MGVGSRLGSIGVILLGAELFHPVAQVGVVVEEVDGDAGSAGQAAKVNGMTVLDHGSKASLSTGNGCLLFGSCGRA